MDDFQGQESHYHKTDFPNFPNGWLPAWRQSDWGREVTFEVVQRLDKHAAAGREITCEMAIKEARDVLKCYSIRSHELYACLHDEDPFFSNQAKREVSELNAFLRRFDKPVAAQATPMFQAA